jgi:hypothetical protein
MIDSQHDRLWTAVIIVILAIVAVCTNVACILTPLPSPDPALAPSPLPPEPLQPASLQPAPLAPSPLPLAPSPSPLPAAPWWVTNAQAFVEANCK